jgi:hypothetical protein
MVLTEGELKEEKKEQVYMDETRRRGTNVKEKEQVT